jgi:hypothetical protein
MDWLFGKTPIMTAREFGSYNMDDSFIITRPKSLERSNTTMSREGSVKREYFEWHPILEYVEIDFLAFT